MKKIMFNDKYGLTQAVLEGRKTQTRRMFTTYKYNMVDWKAFAECGNDCIITDDAFEPTDIRSLAAYKIGEEVAIAQRYSDNAEWAFPYKEYGCAAGWSNKMFVKAELMPYRIRITNIRVERLQDISEEDCLNEGLEWAHGIFYVNYNKETGSRMNLGNDYHNAFAALINKISGKGTWDSNPWVFVYDFELVK